MHRIANFVVIGLLLGSIDLISARPALGDPPPLTPVRFLPGDTQIGTAAFNQTQPAAARGGDRTLVVWIDASTSHPLAGVQSEGDIFATRLDAQGHPMEVTPIVVRQDAGYQRDPRVAWNGENWLVLWENQTYTGSYYETRIFGTRVSPEGVSCSMRSRSSPSATMRPKRSMWWPTAPTGLW